MKKYKLTDETIKMNGHTLHRIVCVAAFSDVAAGKKGGWIESEKNLSQIGNAWVSGDARVYGNALVSGDAWASGDAQVYGDALVHGEALVYGDALVHGEALVFGNAWVSGDARVYGNARVSGNARVYGDARVFGNARVYGEAWVYGNARVYGEAWVYGEAQVSGNAIVESINDYIVFKNFWSSGRYFTWTRSNNMWKVGCFHGTGQQLIEKARNDSPRSGREYERAVRYVESILTDEKGDTEI